VVDKLTREVYKNSFGPTVGDRVRLGDTDLWIEVTHDLTFGGDEAVFGGGKSIRESMLQGTTTSADGAPDTVITNVIILDAKPLPKDVRNARPKGARGEFADTEYPIVRADVGIKDGKIVAIGKSGNRDVQADVTDGLHIGPSTDIIAGEGKILTAGAVDTHVHFISHAEVMEAVATGITTVVGGGVGPSEGSKATTVTPGPRHLINMHRSFDHLPVNVLLLCKGSTVNQDALEEQALAGAGGYKIHEDWGATPAAIDAALTAARKWGLQVALHADTLNEAGFVEMTRNATFNRRPSGGEPADRRPLHLFHAEGAGGGHAPDIMAMAGDEDVLSASTNPTLPYTANTKPEHLDMLAAAHHLDLGNPTDLQFAESRLREATMAAEDVLHDMGAIPIVSSDAQAMGRIGEVITRTWQVAHVMKDRHKDDDPVGVPPADNQRALRYVAKYTINPAVAHGIDKHVGSVEADKLADLVLWDPRFFGIRPELVIKGGAMVRGNVGDPNGSVTTPQPTFIRPAMADAIAADLSYAFVSPKALIEKSFEDWSGRNQGKASPLHPEVGRAKNTLVEILGLRRELVGVEDTRGITKKDMVFNQENPTILIDPEGFSVSIAREGAEPRRIDQFEPVDMTKPDPADSSKKQKLPLAQLYTMF